MTCHDSIGIMMCARINGHYRDMLREKAILCLQPYFDAVDKLLWPRFQYVLALNTESVRQTDPQKLARVDTRPHFIVRR